jgi:UDP-3-O-[3-hydroxymyristoyl] N-acetylglucosamine deacetylase
VGLHSGESAVVRLVPARANEGRFFQKGNEAGGQSFRVPASVKNVRDARLSTCLGEGPAIVRTVEHLLSALEGLGVDNCQIDIDGNEVGSFILPALLVLISPEA